MLSLKAKGLTGMDESVKRGARPAASRSLREAIRKARVDEAERLDRSADRRDGEIARLELLKAELEAVFAELPEQDQRFNLVLVPSRPARLWIDLFTYAAIDDASGAYLFVRNSESGRRTLFSASNVTDSPIASPAIWRRRSCGGNGRKRRSARRAAWSAAESFDLQARRSAW